MSQKQANYERLLDSVQKKEDENFERDLKNEILPEIVNFINNEIKTLEHENAGKSLERLRNCYKDIIKEDASNYRKHEILNNMLFYINGWKSRTNKRLEVKSTMHPRYYGKAAYVDKYKLVIYNVK